MDVNSAEWSQSEFVKLAKDCPQRDGVICTENSYACRDYMCYKVQAAVNIKEVREIFAFNKE